MAKYTPETKEELKALIKDESIYLGDIDTSKITDMSELFLYSKREDFSGIEKWDVSNVKDMDSMFWGCESFNQDLSSWDVSSVKNMEDMFYDCKTFNQPLNDWDVSSVINMKGMFRGCENFNQPLNDWDVSRVENMRGMFKNCTSFNQPLGDWYVSKVTNMAGMFWGCESFNQDLSSWDVSSVKNMASMFTYCTSFNQDISGWDVSNVKNMSHMFKNCTSFNQPLGDWDVSNVKDMSWMFKGCESFNQDISGWNVSGVKDMAGMFDECKTFNQDISGWDVSGVKDMSYMFSGCRNFNQDISSWYVSNVEYKEDMFENCPIDNSNKPDVLQNEIFTKAFRFTDEGDLVITLTPDFEYFLAENQIKNSQDFADKFSDTIDENRYFDIPRILCYKEDLKSTPFEDFDNEYFVFVPNGTNDLDSLSYAVSALNPSIQKDFLIEAMKTKIEEGEINKENLKENLVNEIKYISEQIPIVFEGKVGEDTIEKLLKEKETIVLPNVTKYAKNSINEYFENEKVEILEELKKHFNHSYKNK
ncbi:BspA family leucine-rich repeat surface protein [Campylobacter jejuni]